MTRVRRGLHAACVLAGLLAAAACVPALKLPHPAGAVSALVTVTIAGAIAGSVLAPERTRPAPAGTEGDLS